MNEMYNMSIVTHNYGVFFVLGVIVINFIFAITATDIKKYARAMRLFNPIGATAIGMVLFTGVIMMAAKHLEFSVANVIMIVFVISLMVLEGKRASKLKWTNPAELDALINYKNYVVKVFIIETTLVLSMSAWMWSVS